ncbi:MAG: hypothetical protein AAGU75_07790 [Bacillota bacterium]
MTRNKTSLISILVSMLILFLCIGVMTACERDSAADVLKKKKIAGHTIAVCKFSNETIGLAIKTKEGYTPFFTMYETDTKDVSVEQFKIRGNYSALEHDLFCVMFYIKSIDEYETAFFYFDEKENPVCIALCKNRFYLVDLDDDNDSEIVTTRWDNEKEIETTLVYDWQDGKAVVSNIVESARRVYNVPDEAIISVGVELPNNVDAGGSPDANIFPEYGAYMSFKFEYSIPPDESRHTGLHVWFRHLKDFEPFIYEE